MLYQVKSDNRSIGKIFLSILLEETKYFAMTADFAALCLCAPTKMEHISKIL